MKQFKNRWFLLLGMAFLVTAAAGIWQDLFFPYDHYLRLHVLAHSDRVYDQRLKLEVRNEMIAVLTPVLSGAEDAEEAVRLVQAHLEDLTRAAQDVVRRYGYSYPVSAEIGSFDFPDRQYDSLFLPEGNYKALRVRIGKAEGHNWWCVLYPPLCLASDGQTLGTVPKEKPEIRFFAVDLLHKWQKFYQESK